MPTQATVDGRTRGFGFDEFLDHGDEVIERQKQQSTQLHHHRLLGGCERRLQTMRRVRSVVEVGSSLPLANRRLGDVVALRQHRYRLIAGRDLGAHRRGGTRLLVQGDQHDDDSPPLELDRMLAAASPAALRAPGEAAASRDLFFAFISAMSVCKTSRAKNNGKRLGAI
jgi:hypothetical protein